MKLKQSLHDLGLDAAHLYAVVPSAVFTVDKNLRITSWNQRAAEITGYCLEDALGSSCTLMGSVSCSRGCGLFDTSVTKPIMNRECEIKTKDGQTRYVSKNVDILTNSDGSIIGGIECFEDVTDRKRAENILREQAEIVNVVTHPVYAVDKDMNYLFGNHNLLARLKLASLDDLKGKNYRDFHNIGQTVEFELRVTDVFVTGKPARYVYTSERNNGGKYLRTLSPHFDETGQVDSVTISSKPMDASDSPVEDATELVTVCSYCKKISGEGSQFEWKDMEVYFRQLYNLAFSHGICPECYDDALKKLSAVEL